MNGGIFRLTLAFYVSRAGQQSLIKARRGSFSFFNCNKNDTFTINKNPNHTLLFFFSSTHQLSINDSFYRIHIFFMVMRVCWYFDDDRQEIFVDHMEFFPYFSSFFLINDRFFFGSPDAARKASKE